MSVGGRSGEKSTYLQMDVQGFLLDSASQSPMVLLKNEKEDLSFPIWLTTLESVAIAAELINRDAVAERGCRDLITRLFEKMRVEVRCISIDALRGNVLDSSMTFSREGEEIQVKVRACEAIVMAVKYALPVQVAREVLEEASNLDLDPEEGLGEKDAGRLIRMLEEMDPKDMGKYPM